MEGGLMSSTDSRANLNLGQQRKRAKELRREQRAGSAEAAVRIMVHLPRARTQTAGQVLASPFTLSEAQLVVAREAGFSSWAAMRHELDERARSQSITEDALIDLAFAGNDDAVQTLLEREPALVRQSIFAAAAVADSESAFMLLDTDPSLANRRGGRREWTPLLYLCCSRYLRGEASATAARLVITRRLLHLGADVNATGKEPGYTTDSVSGGFDDAHWQPLEGAAGRVASPELVGLLLESGADLFKTTAVLTHAVRGGDVDVLRRLLERAPQSWYQHIWALRACVLLERPEMAEILVDHQKRSQDAGSTVPKHALMEAIQLERDPQLIDILLGGAAESELGHLMCQNLLRYAVRYGQFATADLLRHRGADDAMVTEIDRVIGACVAGDRAEAQRLLGASARLRGTFNQEDHLMLSWAIRRGHGEAVPLLLEVGIDPTVADNDGDTPLHLAVRASSLEWVQTLLSAGARVDARNFDMQTPLDLALTLSNAEARDQLTRHLLNCGARPGAVTPFTAALDSRHVDPRHGAHQEDPDLLFERAADAVAFGDLETLRALLDQYPALVHARSPRAHRCTLLHYCGANGTEAPRQRTPSNAPAIAELLLEHGADPNSTCKLYGGGSTTMGLLLTSMHPHAAGLDGELVRVLGRFGARIDTSDLMHAIDSGAGLAVAAMVEAGVPVDNLFVASALGRLDLMEDLLSRGAEINARGSNWHSTALHAAAGMDQKAAALFLLDRGADRSLHNVWEAAPADTARHFGHHELADLIDAHRPSP
jgi:ankyrin repeat protein